MKKKPKIYRQSWDMWRWFWCLFVSEKVKAAVDSQNYTVTNGMAVNAKFENKELGVHIFPMSDKFSIHQDQRLQYILAPTDESCTTYLPAKVEEPTKPTKSDYLVLKFCNGYR